MIGLLENQVKRVVCVARGVLLDEKGDLVMVRKDANAGTIIDGEWHLPGGKVKDSETWATGVCREFKQETGVTVRPVEILGATEPIYCDGEVMYMTVYFRLETDDWSGLGKHVAYREIDLLQKFTWAEAQTQMGKKSQGWLPKGFWHMIQPCYVRMREIKFEVGDILTFHNNFTLRIATADDKECNFDQGTVWATPRTHTRIREEMLGGTIIKLTRGEETIWEWK